MQGSKHLLGEFADFFPHSSLTKVQERVLPSILHSADNVLVAAPTGSGKTLLLEVAILTLFKDRVLPVIVSTNDEQVNFLTNASTCFVKKAVYICPIKSLASEKYTHWVSLFPKLKVVMDTGDQETPKIDGQVPLDKIFSADVIITTPERWDSITRRWNEKNVFQIVNHVGLVLLDEIHTVGEERGAALEAIVGRMKAIKEGVKNGSVQRTRFIGVSATLPNVSDLASWIGAPQNLVFSFSNEERPVPLTIRILSYQSDSNNPFAFDRFLSYKLFNLVRQYGDGKPSIVFCSTRSQAVASAQQLIRNIKEATERECTARELEPSEEVRNIVEQLNDSALRSCALLGIAFHHAALSVNDRRIIERLFRERFIAVVCTTTTLSLGVNLPAHLVIVKGTTLHNRGKSTDVPISEVAQMCGRAGRPGQDDHGIALVLTTASKQKLYQSLLIGEAGLEVVESQLHRHIIEHVNAEVSLGTIFNLDSAIKWVKSTFFWIRLNKNPEYYGLTFSTAASRGAFNAEKYVHLLMEKVLAALEEAKCISSSSSGDTVKPFSAVQVTSIGRSMSRLYISFTTIVHLNAILKTKREFLSKGSSSFPLFSLAFTLQALSQTEEFSDIHLRQGDRGSLNALNRTIRFPLSNGYKGGREIRENWHKISVLIQAMLMGHHFVDMSLRNDSFRLLSSLQRSGRFLSDYANWSKSFSFIVSAEKLRVMLEKKLWPNGLILKQLNCVTESIAQSLNEVGIRTLDDVLRLEPRKIEALCSKTPPFGSLLRRNAGEIPVVSVFMDNSIQSGQLYKIIISFACKDAPPNKSQALDRTPSSFSHWQFHLVIGDSNDVVLLSRTISFSGSQTTYDFTFSTQDSNAVMMVHLICLCFVGVDKNFVFSNGELIIQDCYEEFPQVANFHAQKKMRTTTTCCESAEKKSGKTLNSDSSPQTEENVPKIEQTVEDFNSTAIDSVEVDTEAAFVLNVGLNSSHSDDAALSATPPRPVPEVCGTPSKLSFEKNQCSPQFINTPVDFLPPGKVYRYEGVPPDVSSFSNGYFNFDISSASVSYPACKLADAPRLAYKSYPSLRTNEPFYYLASHHSEDFRGRLEPSNKFRSYCNEESQISDYSHYNHPYSSINKIPQFFDASFSPQGNSDLVASKLRKTQFESLNYSEKKLNADRCVHFCPQKIASEHSFMGYSSDFGSMVLPSYSYTKEQFPPNIYYPLPYDNCNDEQPCANIRKPRSDTLSFFKNSRQNYDKTSWW